MDALWHEVEVCTDDIINSDAKAQHLADVMPECTLMLWIIVLKIKVYCEVFTDANDECFFLHMPPLGKHESRNCGLKPQCYRMAPASERRANDWRLQYLLQRSASAPYMSTLAHNSASRLHR